MVVSHYSPTASVTPCMIQATIHLAVTCTALWQEGFIIDHFSPHSICATDMVALILNNVNPLLFVNLVAGAAKPG